MTKMTPKAMSGEKRAEDLKAERLAAELEAAREMCGLETLESRWRDSLDFHDVSVRSIKWMIENAFAAGMKAEQDAARIRAAK